jgi:SAM-dependent methyltransferase
LQTYAVDMHQPHAIESLQSTFLQQDLRTWLPAWLPNDLNLVYSNRVIQYLPNLTQLIKDIYNHLAPWGRALLHIWWHFSFTKDCMRELKKSLSQQWHILRARLEYISPDIEDPGVYGIYIDITKTDKPLELPLLDSALPETYSAINKKIIPWSELFYNRKLASEKEYALDKDSVLTQNILPST